MDVRVLETSFQRDPCILAESSITKIVSKVERNAYGSSAGTATWEETEGGPLY